MRMGHTHNTTRRRWQWQWRPHPPWAPVMKFIHLSCDFLLSAFCSFSCCIPFFASECRLGHSLTHQICIPLLCYCYCSCARPYTIPEDCSFCTFGGRSTSVAFCRIHLPSCNSYRPWRVVLSVWFAPTLGALRDHRCWIGSETGKPCQDVGCHSKRIRRVCAVRLCPSLSPEYSIGYSRICIYIWCVNGVKKNDGMAENNVNAICLIDIIYKRYTTVVSAMKTAIWREFCTLRQIAVEQHSSRLHITALTVRWRSIPWQPRRWERERESIWLKIQFWMNVHWIASKASVQASNYTMHKRIYLHTTEVCLTWTHCSTVSVRRPTVDFSQGTHLHKICSVIF